MEWGGQEGTKQGRGRVVTVTINDMLGREIFPLLSEEPFVDGSLYQYVKRTIFHNHFVKLLLLYSSVQMFLIIISCDKRGGGLDDLVVPFRTQGFYKLTIGLLR